MSFCHQARHRSLNQLYLCDFEDESRKEETKSELFWVESRTKRVTDYKCWKAKKRQAVLLLGKKVFRNRKRLPKGP